MDALPADPSVYVPFPLQRISRPVFALTQAKIDSISAAWGTLTPLQQLAQRDYWESLSDADLSPIIGGPNPYLIPTPPDGAVLTFNASTGAATFKAPIAGTGGVPNATATVPGLVQLAGGLGGTFSAPTVVVVAAGTAGPLSATDASTTNSRVPAGAAAGGLGGTYPNPTVNPVAVVDRGSWATSTAYAIGNRYTDPNGLRRDVITAYTSAATYGAADTAATSVAGAATVGAGGPPSGTAGGGLGGTYPNPTVNPIAVPGGLVATGTASSSTFLNGVGAWATPAGGGAATPAAAIKPGGVGASGSGWGIPAGSLENLRAGFLAAASAPCEIVYFGDSTGFGAGGSGGPVRKIRDLLTITAGLTDGGRGVASPNETAITSGENLIPFVGAAGFGLPSNGYDFLCTDTSSSTAAGETVTFQGKGTAIRLYTTRFDYNSGRFTYKVDSAAAVTVDGSGPPSTTDILTTYIGGLAEGTHTVVVTNLANNTVPSPSGPGAFWNGTSATGTGGTIPAGNYDFVATGVTATGETVASVTSGSVAVAAGQNMALSVDYRNGNAESITTVRFFARLGGTGAFGFIGSVAIGASNAFTNYTWTGTPARATATVPPTTSTAGFFGTTARCSVSFEFVRAVGVVAHKQAISGITSGTFFDTTKSASTTFANANSLAALGMQQMTGNSPPNGKDYGLASATKPNARTVKAALFALGINDQQGASSEASAVTSVLSMIEAFGMFVRMCKQIGADPIMVVPHYVYSSGAERYSGRFRQAAISTAVAHSCAWVDLNVALGPITGTSWAGAPHLSQAQYDIEGQFVYDKILSLVLPGV